MDTELQKELLAILREIKNGAPGAWSMLVEQRLTYCLTMAVCLTTLGLCIGIVGWRAITAGFRRSDTDAWEGASLPLVLVGAGMAAAGMIVLGHTIEWWAAYAAPLGQLLGKVS